MPLARLAAEMGRLGAWACALIAMLGAQPALAHPHEQLAECLDFDEPGQRLACFEQAVAAPGSDRQQRAVAKRPSNIEPSAPNTESSAADAQGAVSAAKQTVMETHGGLSAALEQSPDGPDAGPASADVARAAIEPRPHARSASGVRVTVVRLSAMAGKPIVFYLASGEVWQQTRQRMTSLPEPPFEATMRRGAFGSHRLRVTQRSPAIGIRRIR
ncbi:MAG: hypothetical protein OXE83_13585 [Gammaproteobacteria bacterium]|nr:hypothetical protein [Gammaproteobacteria bacterium]